MADCRTRSGDESEIASEESEMCLEESEIGSEDGAGVDQTTWSLPAETSLSSKAVVSSPRARPRRTLRAILR